MDVQACFTFSGQTLTTTENIPERVILSRVASGG